MKIEYTEADLGYVMGFWVKQYKLPPNTHLHDWKWTWNPETQTVVFKLFIADGPDPLKR